MPIYYVVAEDKPNRMMYSVWHILQVYECNIDEVIRYQEEVNRFYTEGRRIQTFIFYREPENPLRERTHEQH